MKKNLNKQNNKGRSGDDKRVLRLNPWNRITSPIPSRSTMRSWSQAKAITPGPIPRTRTSRTERDRLPQAARRVSAEARINTGRKTFSGYQKKRAGHSSKAMPSSRISGRSLMRQWPRLRRRTSHGTKPARTPSKVSCPRTMRGLPWTNTGWGS